MKNKLLNNLIVFMLVSSTGGLLFVFNRNLSFLFFSLIIICSLFLLGKGLKSKNFYSTFLAFVTVITLFIINFFIAEVQPQSLTKYLFFGVIFFTTTLSLFYFNNQENKNALLDSLYFILKLILFHSLISFFLYPLVESNLDIIKAYMDNGEEKHTTKTFKYLLYYIDASEKPEAQVTLFGINLIRNSSIFWEPGILQFYLNLLFFLEMSVFKRKNFMLILIALAILSTYSTTGLLLLMVQMVYFLNRQFKKKYSGIIIFIIAVPVYIVLSSNINAKIYGEGESSFQKRLLDFTQPLFIALEHPINGIGVDLDKFSDFRTDFYPDSDLLQSFYKLIAVGQNNQTTYKGSTNSFTYLLAGLGFPTMIILIYAFAKQQIIRHNKMIFIILIFVSAMSEPLLHKPLFFMFIISGFINFFNKVISHKSSLL
jgi:hypothetical protein